MIAWLTDPANWSGPNGIPVRLGEHVTISVLSLLIASAIALPIGLWIGHTGRASTLAVNTANIGRAIPSLAAIGLLVPITQAIDPELGFKVYPTLIAMVILAVPPILVNAYAGVSGVDRELVEAARGMGLHERQILRGVEMPDRPAGHRRRPPLGVRPGDRDGDAGGDLRLRRTRPLPRRRGRPERRRPALRRRLPRGRRWP